MAALVEPNRGLIELYFRADVLNDAIDALERRGAQTVRVDAGDWQADTALASLANALDFPDHFGNNLDALADCLFDVVSGEYGFAVGSSIKVLAIYQFDSFVSASATRAAQVLDVMYESALVGLKLGKPFLVLLQSDDGDLSLPEVGSQSIGWNRAEFSSSTRTSR